MPRKSRQIVFGHVIAKIVQQQEWIELAGVPEPERPAQMHTGALQSWLGADQPLNRSNRHGPILPKARNSVP